jgi:uncharacterized protein YuzE
MGAPSIRVEIDTEAGAAYVALTSAPVARTVELTDSVLLDLDEFDIAVGVEVLELAAEIPFTRLVRDYHVSTDVVDLLRAIQPSVSGFLMMHAAEGVTKAEQNSLQALSTW